MKYLKVESDNEEMSKLSGRLSTGSSSPKNQGFNEEISNDLKETITKLDDGYSDSAVGKKNIADVYNEIGADKYDEWAVAVNFNTPNYLVE